MRHRRRLAKHGVADMARPRIVGWDRLDVGDGRVDMFPIVDSPHGFDLVGHDKAVISLADACTLCNLS